MPYSIALLACGRSTQNIIYGDGILCYVQSDSVRILDVHGASKKEIVIDMRAVIRELPIYNQETEITDIGTMVGCTNGILMMSVEYSDTPMLVVIDVREKVVSTTQSPSRIRKIYSPYYMEDVITDGRYLFCVDDPAGGPEWTLKCYDLSTTDGLPSTIALHEFLPREEDCRFQIFDGWFYAICANEDGEYPSQEDGEEELYYSCCRFPIDDSASAKKPEDFLGDESRTPLPARLQAVQLLRGFGKDDWKHRCDGLLKDETTGELFIVESANFPEGHYADPLSDNIYRRLNFPDPMDHPPNSWETRISEIVQFQQESSSRDHYKHHSTPLEGGKDVRGHVPASQSIVDITRGITEGDLRVETTQQFLHLHTRPTHLHPGSTDPDARSTDRGEWRFPPKSAPQELRDILNMPYEYILVGDERSLVIMILDQNGMNHRIILVNFDSGINFPNLKYLALENLSDQLSSFTRSAYASEHEETSELQLKLESASRSEKMRELQVKLVQLAEEPRTSSITTAAVEAHNAPKAKAPDGPKAEVPVAHPWFTKEEAGYLRLEQGFQFYPPA